MSHHHLQTTITGWMYILITVLAFPCCGGSGDAKNLADAKRSVSAALDSLELEKQSLKRQGGSLAELEELTGRLHDSAEVIKQQLSSAGESAPEDLVPEKSGGMIPPELRAFVKPANLFDWLILIVGTIAILSGCILIVGFIHSVFFRKRKKRGNEVLSRKLAQTAQQKERSAVPVRASARTPADSGDLDVTGLRKRINREIEHIQRFNPASPPFAEEEIRNTEHDSVPPSVNRETILGAVRNGLSVQEISRKYHVSVDQVTLIQRIAEKEARQKNTGN